MEFKETYIKGLIIVTPQIWKDKRGYFFESYNKKDFFDAGIKSNFIQDNQAKSDFGVLRGLHYQTGDYSQAKLVRVIDGEVFDIAVDMREESETYGRWFGIKLSAENHKQLFIPRRFAHGYIVMSKSAVFSYKCDNLYNPESEGGVIYNDPKINIDWGLIEKDLIISEKDKNLPFFGDHKK